MCERQACKIASDMFKQQFNCAESVISGIANELNIETELIPKIASGFGAGISKQGQVCGALSGAIMGLGLKYGRSTPDNDTKAALYKMVGEFWTKFQSEFGTVMCKELTGCDMMTEEGMNDFKSRNLHNTLCIKYVIWCVEQAMMYLEQKS